MNEFVAGHQIAQLVGAAELNLAAVYLVQVVEVVSLEHLVGELCQAHPVCAPQPGLHAVAAEHGAHPKMPSGLRQEFHNVPVLVPAQVVQYGRGAKCLAAVVKVQLMVGEYPVEALTDASGVRLRCVRRQQIPLARFPTRVSDLCRGASEHSQDVVSSITEVQKTDYSE